MDHDDGQLTLAYSASDQEVTVTIAGELDPHTSEQFSGALQEVDDRPPRVVLDLSDVSFIDSSGLRVILATEEELTAQGRHLVLRSPSEAVKRLLEITDLLDRLNVE